MSDSNNPHDEEDSTAHIRESTSHNDDKTEALLSPKSPPLISKEEGLNEAGALNDLGYSLPSTPELKATSYELVYLMLNPLNLDSDEYGVFSDSDKGSVNSDDNVKVMLDKKYAISKRRKSSGARGNSNYLKSPDATPTTKNRKRSSRRSHKSDSERSYKHPDGHIGGGYTLAPATGKVFRNLLIMEESLRQQVIQQRAYRRKYLTFLSILCSLIASIGHHLYFTESSNTNSAILVILRFTLFALIVTLMLYHLSGEYQKTIVLPRKFLSSTNKGLRQLNVRLVKIKTPILDKITDLIRELILVNTVMCLNCLHNVYPSTKGNKNSKLEVLLVRCQQQCQPRTGITDVKLVLNPRVFRTDIREGWELYRSEFWVEEGLRRRARMLAFLEEDANAQSKEKIIRRERKERKQKRKSNAGLTRLDEQNLRKIGEAFQSELSSSKQETQQT